MVGKEMVTIKFVLIAFIKGLVCLDGRVDCLDSCTSQNNSK